MSKALVRLLATAVLLLPTHTAYAAQTLTLSVPQRSLGATSQPETARVTLSFDTTALDTVRGISVDGTALSFPTTSCDAAAATCSSLTAFGSRTARVRWVSPTQVNLTLILHSDLATNLCGSVSGDRTFSIALTGINATTYRMSGYSVPSVDTTLAVQCSTPYRRVGMNKPFFSSIAGVPLLSAAANNRLPLDVVLVLDKSGSMSGFFPGSSSGDRRWDRLKDSVQEFVQLWEVATSPGVEGNPKDRLSLVFFDGSAVGVAPDPGGALFKERGASDTSWDGVFDRLTERSPGGSTSIGAGVALARSELAAVADPNDATVILFTDGAQNTTPLIEADSGTTSPLELNGDRLMDFAFPILTIGLGASSGPFATRLDQISRETAGRAQITNNGVSMSVTFANDLLEVLKGNTLSLNRRELGKVPAGALNSDTLTSFIDASSKRVVFSLSWEGASSANALELEVRNPLGKEVDAHALKRGSFHRIFAVDLKGPQSFGDWSVRATRRSPSQVEVNYQLSAYSVEGMLSYRFVDSARLGTGQPVVVKAEVGWEGKALAGLPAGAIKVTIERPSENLGNILFNSEVKGAPNAQQGDAQDALASKLDLLALNDKLVDRTSPKALPTSVTMTEVGAGIYSTVFSDTIVGGHYRLRFDLDWTDSRTGRIKRTEMVERQIPVVPDAVHSLVSPIKGDTGSVTGLMVTPLDRFGNYVGPGYASSFVVTVGGTKPTNLAISDVANRGVYAIQLGSVVGDPTVAVEFAGAMLANSPLSRVGTKVADTGCRNGCTCCRPGVGGETTGLLGGMALMGLASVLVRRRRGRRTSG